MALWEEPALAGLVGDVTGAVEVALAAGVATAEVVALEATEGVAEAEAEAEAEVALGDETGAVGEAPPGRAPFTQLAAAGKLPSG